MRTQITPQFMKRTVFAAAAAYCLLLGDTAAIADVRTDGSVGAIQALSGKMVIPQTLGQVRGQNLFHSFSFLNVNPGESLSFTSTDNLQNIIARVTGGTASTIQGQLQVQAASGSKPNFYLMNPKGIVFAEGAVIDVPAGLHVTTANYLQFSDGQFHADLQKTSHLSSAAPEAFGFLGGQRSTVKFTGRANLLPVSSREVNLVAGDVVVEDTWLKSYGGEIRVMAVGDAAGLVSSRNTPELKGNITITDGGLLDSSGAKGVNGGNILVSGGDIQIGSPELISFNGISSNATAESGKAGNIMVRATGSLQIIGGNSITSSTHGAADGGSVDIHARNISIVGQNLTSTGIHSNAEDGTGNAGRVNVLVDETLHIENGGAIASSTFADGKAGFVTVMAKNITLDGKGISTGIVSETSSYQSDSGIGGEVRVQASEKISIIEGASISASSYTAGNRYKAGSAGQIFVQTKDLAIDGLGDDDTGIRSFTASVGNAGNITIQASGEVQIANAGNITTATNFLGAGGDIKLSAKNLILDGKGNGRTGIFSNVGTQGSGNAGTLQITVAENLLLKNSAKVSSSTDSYREGSANAVDVSARNILVRGVLDPELPQTEIASAAHASDFDRYSSGNAGAVSVIAKETLSLLDGATISSSTYYKGKAGTVSIESTKLNMDAGAKIISEAGEFSTGQTGNITIRASELMSLDQANISVKNAATVTSPEKILGTSLQIQTNQLHVQASEITAASSGNVAASQIQVGAGQEMRMQSSVITTSAVNGNGGSIRVNGQGSVILQQSQISTSVSGVENGNGGNIQISAPVMVLSNGAIQANTAAPKAAGGDVNIQVSDILSSGNRLRVGGAPVAFDLASSKFNVIQAAAADGVSGLISLASPPIDLSASLSNLMPQLMDTSELITDFCRVSSQSSMTILGRGGLPFSIKGLSRSQ